MELPRNSDHPRGVLGIPELGTPDCWIEDMIERGLAQATAMTNGIGTNAAIF
jgi:hypothetical protein